MIFHNPFGIAIVKGTSMNPQFSDGDLVITRRCRDINLNDIIVFREPHINILVIHRVMRREGSWFFTKGDTNEVSDPNPLTIKQSSGKVGIKIPWIGRFIQHAQ